VSKNILIFSDGTGQAGVASDEGRWSNIYKLYRATRVSSDTRRANLLLHGAKWIGVAHAQNGHRIYWAMVIGAK
jgi:hypothetical protein